MVMEEMNRKLEALEAKVTKAPFKIGPSARCIRSYKGVVGPALVDITMTDEKTFYSVRTIHGAAIYTTERQEVLNFLAAN